MIAAPPTSPPRFALGRYAPSHAALIATWPRDALELQWLAPGTPPPLDAEKVAAWASSDDQRFVLWDAERLSPVGYAELNFLSLARDQMWIGHFVIDPRFRGVGLAARFAAGLLDLAFARFAARMVVLLVFPDNVRAIRCYQRVGFVEDGYEAKYFPKIDCEHRFRRMFIDAERYLNLASSAVLPCVGATCGVGAPVEVNPVIVGGGAVHAH
jgi:RimJ/RimL family protein N-acetyltransferase